MFVVSSLHAVIYLKSQSNDFAFDKYVSPPESFFICVLTNCITVDINEIQSEQTFALQVRVQSQLIGNYGLLFQLEI